MQLKCWLQRKCRAASLQIFKGTTASLANPCFSWWHDYIAGQHANRLSEAAALPARGDRNAAFRRGKRTGDRRLLHQPCLGLNPALQIPSILASKNNAKLKIIIIQIKKAACWFKAVFWLVVVLFSYCFNEKTPSAELSGTFSNSCTHKLALTLIKLDCIGILKGFQ